MNDSLGDRIKSQYENRTRFLLPRRTYTLIRCDGRAFHTYTRGLARPFDADFAADMDAATIALCESVQGAKLGYVQSDEISVLLTDFDQPNTAAWFDGTVQKIASLAASIVTAAFNQARLRRHLAQHDATRAVDAALAFTPATFDARCFVIPDLAEVFNYFVWRQKDATRNSISMTAQAHLPASVLHGKNTSELQELLWQEKGVNWAHQPEGFKNGRVVTRQASVKDVTYTDKRTGETRTASGVTRHEWIAAPAPVFLRQPEWLRAQIPSHASDRSGSG
jgi:tRNA(His) 5'-end guanylyltransferase